MATEETPLLLPPHETTTTTTTTNGLLLLSPPPPPSGGGTDEVGGGEEEEVEEKDETTAKINTKTPKTTNKKRSSSLSIVSKVNDEYIISLIRRTRTSTSRTVDENDITTSNNDDDGSLLADDDDNMNNNSDVDENDGTETRPGGGGNSDDGTTFGQTVIHLVKGYIGCGILSLPWAISQLGIPVGLLAIVFMSLWSSYNCWTVVKIKQYLERTQTIHNDNNNTDDESVSSDDDDDDYSGRSRISRRTSDISMASSNITYPDVGEWAHGIEFQKYISICICAQQLAICTVFISFVSENLSASLKFFDVPTHIGLLHLNHISVGAMILPIILGLSCGLPTVKSMAPFMVCAFVLMISGFASLGYIGYLKWDDRPTSLTIDDGGDSNELGLPTFQFDKNAPMALCGILYSFEGICIILPVENSMIKYDNTNTTATITNTNNQRRKRQRKYYHSFQMAFIISMIIITLLLCTMAGMGVYVFGTVTNGSITAFLLDEYKDSTEIQFWVMFSNVLVTISIIFSYPLMLYPAIECIAPTYHEWTVNIKRKYNHFWTSIRLAQERNQNRRNSHHHRNNLNRNNDDDSNSSSSTNSRLDDESSGFNTFNTCKTSEEDDGTNHDESGVNNKNEDNDNENDNSEDQNLAEFERMVGIPEHKVASVRSLKSLLLPKSTYPHDSDTNNNNEGIKSTSAGAAAVNDDDNETADTGEATDGGGLDGSASLSHYSSVTYPRQSLVDGEDDEDDADDGNNNNTRRSNNNRRGRAVSTAFTWHVPGDSPYFRAVIVMGTYCIAMLVPNVQSLVAVVGAVTGSSTALLIPPILELAYIRHLETLQERRIRKHKTPPLESEWEGGPSKALKRTLLESSYSQQSQSSPSSSSQSQTMHTNIYQPRHRSHPNNNSNTNTNTRSKRERRNNNTNRTHRRRKKKKYFFEKILSWFLLILGSIFALIGSYFSIRDIIQSYE